MYMCMYTGLKSPAGMSCQWLLWSPLALPAAVASRRLAGGARRMRFGGDHGTDAGHLEGASNGDTGKRRVSDNSSGREVRQERQESLGNATGAHRATAVRFGVPPPHLRRLLRVRERNEDSNIDSVAP